MGRYWGSMSESNRLKPHDMLFCVLGRKDPVAAVIMTSGPLPNILRIRLTIEFNTLSWLGRADADNQVKPIESNE